MKPTVLFLDMDGPFCSGRAVLAGLQFDPISAKIVNDIIKLPEVRVVISSTVRKLCDDIDDARERLLRYGLKGMTFHEHWRTGDSRGKRSDEVEEWYNLHFEPNTQYIAIDDDPINIEGVIHIKADRNGIAHEPLLHLLCLADKASWKTYHDWQEWLVGR